MYRIVYTKQAAKDIINLKQAGLAEKAKVLIDIVRTDPFKSPPPFERLVGNMYGLCSRRINIRHRLVYQVIEGNLSDEKGNIYQGTVKIIRMWTHYEGAK